MQDFWSVAIFGSNEKLNMKTTWKRNPWPHVGGINAHASVGEF